MLNKFMDFIGSVNKADDDANIGELQKNTESLNQLNLFLDSSLHQKHEQEKEREQQNECQICHESFKSKKHVK